MAGLSVMSGPSRPSPTVSPSRCLQVSQVGHGRRGPSQHMLCLGSPESARRPGRAFKPASVSPSLAVVRALSAVQSRAGLDLVSGRPSQPAFKLSSKPVTVAANSRIAGARRRARLEPTQPEAPGPDGVSDRDWHGLVSRRLTRSQGCQWALPVSRSWVTVAGACRRRLTCGQCH